MVSFEQDAKDAIYLKQSFGQMKSYDNSSFMPRDNDIDKIQYT